MEITHYKDAIYWFNLPSKEMSQRDCDELFAGDYNLTDCGNYVYLD